MRAILMIDFNFIYVQWNHLVYSIMLIFVIQSQIQLIFQIDNDQSVAYGFKMLPAKFKKILHF